jgi:hypothetical protein
MGVGVGVGVGEIVGVGKGEGVGLTVGETVGVGEGLLMTSRRGEMVPQAAMMARMLNIHIGIQWLLPPCELRFISKKDAHKRRAVAALKCAGSGWVTSLRY